MTMPLSSAHDASVVAEAAACAIAFHQRGMLAEAEKFYTAILKAQPDHFDALRLLSVLRQQQGDNDEAMRLISAALRLNPQSYEALGAFGGVLFAFKRHDEALAAFDRALAIEPDHPETLYNRGNTLLVLGRNAEALAAFDRALALRPGHPEMLVNRGTALLHLERAEEALSVFDRVLALDGSHAVAFRNRATAYKVLERYEDARAAYREILGRTPDDVMVLDDYAGTLLLLGRAEEALAAFDRLLALAPDHRRVRKERADLLRALGRHDEAIKGYDALLAATPGDGEVLFGRGKSQWAAGRREAAMASQAQAWALGYPRALAELAMCCMRVADWPRAAELVGPLRAHIAEGSVIDPFVTLAFGSSPLEQFECARRYLATRVVGVAKPFVHSTGVAADRLRVAYLSSDLRQHPVGTAITELIERHNRTRFEIIGVSSGANDGSETRARISRACDRFLDVAADNDRTLATRLHDLNVHIAVDLNGLTGGCRPAVLACRPAPIQVGYLGYAGTTGADFIDYILADETVLPFEEQPFFSETIVHLPDCYHANDTGRPIAPQTPGRGELGLPGHGLVFCCFNQSYKIAAPVFDVWMRLLGEAPGSVLWLTRMDDLTNANLRREAHIRGIDPERLIFAPRMDSVADHLARQRAADLFVDTLPYNAHSTACDALFAGLPVITCRGRSFASRVAASMLKAAGLPELVTGSLAEYEARARALVANPALLAQMRGQLAASRAHCPLFDGDRFRRGIEAAYSVMWDIYRRGEHPRNFRVNDGAPR